MIDTAAPPTSGTVSAGAGRDPLWDTARWVAITLVVVGHSIEVPNTNNLAWGLYLTIYSFHMPLFAFVSGRFAKADALGRRDGAVLLRQLIAPYIIFQTLWAVWALPWRDGDFSLNLAAPYWHLWFLVALVVWRLTIPIFAATRWPVTLSIVVACASGYWASIGLIGAMSRTLVFLPFFVAGWAWHQRGHTARFLLVVRSIPARLTALALMVGTAVAAVEYADWTRTELLRKWAQGEWSYARLGHTDWWPPALERLAVIAFAFAMIAAVLALCPRGEFFVSAWGRRTMTVYMIHLFPIVWIEQQTDFYSRIDTDREIVMLIAAAVAWSIVLSTRPAAFVFRPFVSPRLRWLIAEPVAPGRRIAR